MRRATRVLTIMAVLMSILVGGSSSGQAAQFKVLVVMSYEESMPWVQQIKAGIDRVLQETCEIRYFYMDTKTHLENGEDKAKEAYALYQTFQPDGVIAADDNAQWMFVVPYLKDQVTTPVMFCAVNAEADAYGYPARNVSGILERHHFKETILFSRQLVPLIQTVAYMIKDSPVGDIIIEQMQQESDTYAARVVDYKTPKTLQEMIRMLEELKDRCDALIISTMLGLVDGQGRALTDQDVIPVVLETFGKPVLGTEEQVVRAGALGAVLRTGQEQGATAARMLLDAMQGTPVSDIPITRNQYGKRMLNVMTMRTLGIKPKRSFLVGTELVKN